VLKKLSVSLKSDDIEKLAKAESNFIEELLFDLKAKITSIKAANEANKSGDYGNADSDIVTVTVSKQIGDHVEQVPQRMIQYSIYESLLDKVERQDELINELHEKNVDLEHAIELKVQMIEDLQERLEKQKAVKKTNQTLSINAIKESIANLF